MHAVAWAVRTYFYCSGPLYFALAIPKSGTGEDEFLLVVVPHIFFVDETFFIVIKGAVGFAVAFFEFGQNRFAARVWLSGSR